MKKVCVIMSVLLALCTACIENPLSYPLQVAEITSFEVEGQKSVSIDAANLVVNIVLEETADISALPVVKYEFTEDAKPSSVLPEVIDLSQPLKISYQTYPDQSYEWTIQATQPIEDLADNFRLVKEKQGRVVAQFLKLYYCRQMFKYEREEPVIGEDGRPVMTALGRPKTEKREAVGFFSSRDYDGVDFDVICEAVSGTKSSAAGDIQLLETMFREGKISLRTFIELYPDDAISNKSEILRQIEAEEESLAAELQRQLVTIQSQLASALKKIEADAKTVEGAIGIMRENSNLRKQLIDLYTEASEKIKLANQQVITSDAKVKETTEDARHLAESLWEEKNGKQSN